jgi:hypothetical protein
MEQNNLRQALVSLKVTSFKQSGKYYTDEYLTAVVNFLEDSETPATIYQPDVREQLIAHNKERMHCLITTNNFTCIVEHALMVPFMLSKENTKGLL